MPVEIGQSGTLARFATPQIVGVLAAGGNPIDARKWRIFNNLECSFGAANGDFHTGRSGGPKTSAPHAAVVLVDRGAAVIATRPITAFLTPRANPGASQVVARLNAPGDIFHDQWQRRTSGSDPCSPIERASAV